MTAREFWYKLEDAREHLEAVRRHLHYAALQYADKCAGHDRR